MKSGILFLNFPFFRKKRDLKVENVSFSYDGANRDYVLDGISLFIPERKVTAIVGASGSGKTTLIKLMLGFYLPNKGTVKVNDTSLESINPHLWRAKTGAVMQDGLYLLGNYSTEYCCR